MVFTIFLHSSELLSKGHCKDVCINRQPWKLEFCALPKIKSPSLEMSFLSPAEICLMNKSISGAEDGHECQQLVKAKSLLIGDPLPIMKTHCKHR